MVLFNYLRIIKVTSLRATLNKQSRLPFDMPAERPRYPSNAQNIRTLNGYRVARITKGFLCAVLCIYETQNSKS